MSDLIIKFRVTEGERAVIQRMAAITNTTVSQMLRGLALRARPGVLTPEEFDEFRACLVQLRGACANLNQLTRAVNQRTSRLPNEATLAEISALVGEIDPLVSRLSTLVAP